MGNDSYEEGRAGRPVTSDTDLREYNRGERDRKEADAALTPAAPKVEVPGVAFTILLIAPMLFLVYPVLGLTLYVVAGAVVAVFYFTPLPDGLEIFGGLILCVMSFFPGYKLEAKASQFKPYRFARSLWRVVSFFVLPVALQLGMSLREGNRFDPNNATGGALFGGILIAILIYFVCRTLDRLYFPAWAEVEKLAEMQAKGIPQQRHWLKRMFYSLLWIIPVMVVSNLAIRLLVGALTAGPEERAEFYQQYEAFVYLVGLIVWLILAVTGILPGTGKNVKSFIDHEVLLEQRPQ